MFLVKFSNMPNETASYYILESIFMHVFVAIDGIPFYYILLFYKIIFSFFFKEIIYLFFPNFLSSKNLFSLRHSGYTII